MVRPLPALHVQADVWAGLVCVSAPASDGLLGNTQFSEGCAATQPSLPVASYKAVQLVAAPQARMQALAQATAASSELGNDLQRQEWSAAEFAVCCSRRHAAGPAQHGSAHPCLTLLCRCRRAGSACAGD